MDKLDRIMKEQEGLAERIAEQHGLIFPHHVEELISRDEYNEMLSIWTEKHVLAMFDEVAEVLRETPWKWWKNYQEPINQEKLGEEVIDVMFFGLQLLYLLGYDSDDVFEKYMEKLGVNHNRQDGNVKGREDYAGKD